MKTLRNGPLLEVELESWQDLREMIEKSLGVARAGQPSYLFRGQSDSRWTLRPSLARQVPAGLGEKETREQEEVAILEFQVRAHQFLRISELPQGRDHVVDWWVLMQHYGAATRLLDWTDSPYVATYFAVTGTPDAPGALWVIHAHTVLEFMSRQRS
jgi:hypothetical protein